MNRSGSNTWGGNDRNNNNGLTPRINNSGMPADEKDYNDQSGGYHDYNGDGDGSRRGREGGNEGNDDSKKRDAPPAAAAAAAYHQRNNDSQKKPKTHQIRPCDALTPEQNQYRELVATQLQDGETVGWIHLQAFRHPEGWDKKKALAAEYSKKRVLEELKKITPGTSYSYSDDDGSDSEYSYVGNKPMRTPGTLNDLENKFFDSLPKCTMMMLGFDIGDKVKDERNCWCPCGKQNAKWREHYGLDNLIDKYVVCDNFKAKVPQGLIDHLEHVGGVYCKKSGQVHMKCKFHYGARMFLEYLYNK